MRTFLALSLPDETCRELALMQGGLAGARWLAAHNLHLTLLFLGDLGHDQVEELDWHLQGLALPCFNVTLAGLGCFDRKGVCKAVWAGVAPEPTLERLGKELRRLARNLAIPLDGKGFRPHVTLARFSSRPSAEVMAWIAQQGPLALPPFAVRAFHLYSSRLAPSGADYSIEASYPLAGEELFGDARG